MKRLVSLLLWVTLTALAPAAMSAPRVVALTLDGSIQPASARYLERGLKVAAESGAALVVIQLDTPGGLLLSLRSMTTAITGSGVPVAVYVAPPGARAASAGFFLLMAADVAAMAPGTNAGAAHPVALGGKSGPGQDDTALTKATEDAAALIRALASQRGRSVEWAERAVRESRSYSAEEAEKLGLIERIAPNRAELLRALDGRTIRRFDGRPHVLELQNATLHEVERTLAERLLTVIADPQVAYLLMLLGLLGLAAELLSPGAVVPGVIGGVSLLLAFYGFSILPVSWTGILLIVVGIGLLVAEAFVASWGLLGLTGAACFVLGSLMLVDSPLPGARIGLGLVLPAAVLLALISLFLVSRVLRARRARPITGLEALVGEVGELIEGIEPDRAEGRVFVHGEYWTAIAEQPLPGGSRVRVAGVEGRRLLVRPASHAPT